MLSLDRIGRCIHSPFTLAHNYTSRSERSDHIFSDLDRRHESQLQTDVAQKTAENNLSLSADSECNAEDAPTALAAGEYTGDPSEFEPTG
jgi:hypothetical protein